MQQAYKEIVNKYGALGIMGSEFLGAPDNQRLTLACRENTDFPIPKSWVVIYQVGDGSVLCIDTAKKIYGDNPIVFWFFGEENTERLGARNFATFVIETIWKALLDDGCDVCGYSLYKRKMWHDKI